MTNVVRDSLFGQALRCCFHCHWLLYDDEKKSSTDRLQHDLVDSRCLEIAMGPSRSGNQAGIVGQTVSDPENPLNWPRRVKYFVVAMIWFRYFFVYRGLN